ncbi:MAG: 16S rRNA (adenine(1518)-N(6)/adenine(1519)-N(6))-dimethyltransferase RsmA [Longimicrobiales bacterium]
MRARRSLGQNFLIDPNLQRKIVAAVLETGAASILEIGPGTGALTRHLAAQPRPLVAIELDARCVAQLRAEFATREHVRIIHADALDVELDTIVDDIERLGVVGNIPYNITSPLLFWLLERQPRPLALVLMVQREVADRILAAPGTSDYGALSVGVRAVAAVERLFQVGRQAFRPVPDVDSTVLRITPLRPPPLTPAEEADLRRLTRATFSMRRKQLQKILRSAPSYALEAAALERLEQASGIDLQRRPETLTPEEFITLARQVR